MVTSADSCRMGEVDGVGTVELVCVGGLLRIVRPCNFIKKETLAQVFSSEFCKIATKTFFADLWATAF